MISDALLAEVLARVAKKHPPRKPRPVRKPPDPEGRCPVPLDALLTLDKVDEHREFDCPMYLKCLSEMEGAESFTCRFCEHFGKHTSANELVTIASRRGAGNVP